MIANVFLAMVEQKVVQEKGLDVSRRAENCINNIVGVMDVMLPKKNFRIPKVWRGKSGFRTK